MSTQAQLSTIKIILADFFDSHCNNCTAVTPSMITNSRASSTNSTGNISEDVEISCNNTASALHQLPFFGGPSAFHNQSLSQSDNSSRIDVDLPDVDIKFFIDGRGEQYRASKFCNRRFSDVCFDSESCVSWVEKLCDTTIFDFGPQ